MDGKPIYYLIGRANEVYDGLKAGYLALINCKNITIKNIAISKNGQGILLAYTKNSKIQNCNITNNEFGIELNHSSNNTISNNNIKNNTEGILLALFLNIQFLLSPQIQIIVSPTTI